MIEQPNTALIWFSGNTSHNDRGSLLAYLPVGQEYSAWFAGFQRTAPDWESDNLRGITLQQLCQLQCGSQAYPLAG